MAQAVQPCCPGDVGVTGDRPPAVWPGQISWPYTGAEKVADAVVHGLGIAFALSGTVVLFVVGPHGTTFERVALGVYLVTLFCVLTISAAYNTWPVTRVKWLLRRFDHAAIFLLIAGTYTPLLVRLQAPWLLGGVWLCACIGVVLKLVWPGRYDGLSIALYVALSWSGIVQSHRIFATFSTVTLWLIGVGGFLYMSGIVFHLWTRLPYQNAIWHGFVLTAASIHYAAIWTMLSAPA